MRHFSQGLLNDDKILACLNIRHGQTILDAGCGNGYMAQKFSTLVGHTGRIYAMDSNKLSFHSLIKRFSNTNVEVMDGDITKSTQIQTASLDLVYLSTVFHIFLPAQVTGFDKEMRRVLKPGARLAVVNLKKKEMPFGPPVEMRSSPGELIERLSLFPRELIDINEHFYMQMFERKLRV